MTGNTRHILQSKTNRVHSVYIHTCIRKVVLALTVRSSKAIYTLGKGGKREVKGKVKGGRSTAQRAMKHEVDS